MLRDKLIKNTKNFHFLYFALFLAIWGGLCFSVYIKDDSDFKGDEWGFFSTGNILFEKFFIEQDFQSNIWKKSYLHYGAQNPRVGLYILGASQHIVDIFCNALRLTPTNKIIACRCFTAIFSSLTIFIIGFAIYITEDKKTALLATFLLMINPIFRSISTALLPDTHMLFFVSLFLLSLSVYLKHLSKNNYCSTWLINASIFLGLAISCRIYAVSLYFVFASTILFHLKKSMFLQNITSIFIGGIISAFVFFITNPLLYNNFFEGLKIITVNHLSLSGNIYTLNWSSLHTLFLYPYLLIKNTSFEITGILDQVPLNPSNYIIAACTYTLVLRGLYISIKSKKYIPVFVFIFTHIWVAYPIMVMEDSTQLIPKTFLLPMTSVIWLTAVNISKPNIKKSNLKNQNYKYKEFKGRVFSKKHSPLNNPS